MFQMSNPSLSMEDNFKVVFKINNDDNDDS